VSSDHHGIAIVAIKPDPSTGNITLTWEAGMVRSPGGEGHGFTGPFQPISQTVVRARVTDPGALRPTSTAFIGCAKVRTTATVHRVAHHAGHQHLGQHAVTIKRAFHSDRLTQRLPRGRHWTLSWRSLRTEDRVRRLPCLVRFQTLGSLMASNGAAYEGPPPHPILGQCQIPFPARGQCPGRTYSFYVTPAGGAELTVARFRLPPDGGRVTI